jgi:hypothetical protein
VSLVTAKFLVLFVVVVVMVVVMVAMAVVVVVVVVAVVALAVVAVVVVLNLRMLPYSRSLSRYGPSECTCGSTRGSNGMSLPWHMCRN